MTACGPTASSCSSCSKLHASAAACTTVPPPLSWVPAAAASRRLRPSKTGQACATNRTAMEKLQTDGSEPACFHCHKSYGVPASTPPASQEHSLQAHPPCSRRLRVSNTACINQCSSEHVGWMICWHSPTWSSSKRSLRKALPSRGGVGWGRWPPLPVCSCHSCHSCHCCVSKHDKTKKPAGQMRLARSRLEHRGADVGPVSALKASPQAAAAGWVVASCHRQLCEFLAQ